MLAGDEFQYTHVFDRIFQRCFARLNYRLKSIGGCLGSGQTRMCLKMVSLASGFGGTVQPKPFQSVDVTLW